MRRQTLTDEQCVHVNAFVHDAELGIIDATASDEHETTFASGSVGVGGGGGISKSEDAVHDKD